MPLVKVGEAADITLPEDVREALKLKPGDLLRTEVVEGGVVLTPLSREEALTMIREARKSVEWTGPGPEPGDDEVMELAVETIKEVRRDQREGRI